MGLQHSIRSDDRRAHADKRVSLMKAFEPILAAEAAAAAAEAEAHAARVGQAGADEAADVDMLDQAHLDLEGNVGEDGDPEDRWRVTSMDQQAASAPGGAVLPAASGVSSRHCNRTVIIRCSRIGTTTWSCARSDSEAVQSVDTDAERSSSQMSCLCSIAV